MDSLIPEDPLIIIPASDWKIVEAIRQHDADVKALRRVNEIDNTLNILDKDSADNVNRIAEQEYAIAEAMADLLDARCPKCLEALTKQGRRVSSSDIVNGRCWKCKALIVRGE